LGPPGPAMGFFSLLRGSGWSASVRGLPGRPPVRHSDVTGRPAVTLSFPQLSRSQQRLSVTAGNWLSQHGGRSATGGETVLPRQNRLFPVWCLPCAVKLSTRVAGKHPHSQGSVASSSARRRAPSAPRGGGRVFLGPTRIYISGFACDGQRFFASIRKELGDGDSCRAVVPTCTQLPSSWQRRRLRLPCALRRCSSRRPFIFLGSRVMCK